MRVLIIEDEKRITHFIKKGLKAEHYAVDLAFDGKEGLELAKKNSYDLIILDLMLPKVDGLEVCKTLRKEGHQIPILMLTAKDTLENKIEGLDSGADDYLTKPFAFDELVSRVRAILRRKYRAKNPKLKAGDLEMDTVTHEVKRNGKIVELSSKEYALLEYLIRNTNKVITRTQILEHVWDQNYDSFTNIVDVYIRYLRKKIDKDEKMKLIKTIRGVGYKIKA